MNRPSVILVCDPVTREVLTAGCFTMDNDVLTMTDAEGVPLRCDDKPIQRRLRTGDDKWTIAHFLAWKGYRQQKKSNAGC